MPVQSAAVAIGAHQGAKAVEGPIAAVITPIDAPSPSGQDTESEIASFYALEDPEVILHNAIDDIDVADRLKRTMGMLRMGRSSGVNSPELDEEKRSMGMLRMGKRAMGMLRMGRSDKVSASEDLGKRSMGMLRMGRSSAELDNDEQTSKRAMGMLRMGRSFDDEKRSMGMLRMGRSSRDEQALYEKDKKSMSMLRMG